ncbi:DUF4811 domain-containing protein [Lacticaseibacillus daqingensis]|uniref:DUF4811 domain-containing protein n=1 Tax=Lacticaseibacillus daqingensis TaxID=2486014 RepID=UPI000F7AAEC3|nr:DUF4811 domain-containing protein [Lacticaseibacillus daqingensis]
MILVIMALAAIAYFFVAVLTPHGPRRRLGVTLLGALLILCALGIAANDATHFGFKTVTQTRTTPLVGTPSATTLTTHRVGTAVAVRYRTNPLTTTVKQVTPSATVTTKIRRGPQAHVTTTDRVLAYNGKWAAFLFAWSGQAGQRLHRTVTFTVPSGWQIK